MKIAICIRGSLRSWDVCKHNIFQTFAAIPHKIDWFFDTWDVDAFTYYDIDPLKNTCAAKRVENPLTEKVKSNIIADFERVNENLVSFEVHKFNSQMNPALSFLKLIYLSNTSKRKIELMNNSKYDVVIQIRPDTVFNPELWQSNRCVENILASKDEFGLNFNTSVKTPGQKMNCFNEIQVEDRYGTIVSDVPGIPDFAFYGPSQVLDLLSSAYIDAKRLEEETNSCFPHATLFSFLSRNGVIMYDYFLDVMIVRNMKYRGVYDYEYFKNNPKDVLSFSENFKNGVAACSDVWYNTYTTASKLSEQTPRASSGTTNPLVISGIHAIANPFTNFPEYAQIMPREVRVYSS